MKKRVGILFGGQSAEHEVSLQSAKNIIDAIDRRLYEPVLIGIDKKGVWHLPDSRDYLVKKTDPRQISLNRPAERLSITPGAREGQIDVAGGPGLAGNLDAVFPVLHGPFGEDGTVQGMLKIAHIPFVGASVLGSAVGMDKDVMKRILRDDGIPIADFLTFSQKQRNHISYRDVKERLGLPVFVKPANLGSSVGISRAEGEGDFTKAVEQAFEFDRKIIVEECVPGREIECGVLGNDDPEASVPGEILSNREAHSFYSYEAKYIDEKGAVMDIPAKLEEGVASAIQNLSLRVFKVLCCEGMARVDFFLKPDNAIIVNEINTIPGFTRISMYPKLWEASGKSYTRLITDLIEFAIERHREEEALKTSL